MTSDFQRWCRVVVKHWRPSPLVLGLLLAGCANSPVSPPAPRYDSIGPQPPLAYYQMLSRLSAAEFARERSVLAALPSTPNSQLRMAMQIGHPRALAPDLGKAISLLDGILKSNDPAAVALHPLARLLADNYIERQKQEGQFDRVALQLKESQRKSAELQEKLDGLADIERTLPPRSRIVSPAVSGRPAERAR